jgi:hypothetical protein
MYLYYANDIFPSQEPLNVSYHGSCIFQKLVAFSNIDAIFKSILNLSVHELNSLSCDKFGSWAMQKLLANSSIGQKSLGKLLDKFKVCFSILPY